MGYRRDSWFAANFSCNAKCQVHYAQVKRGFARMYGAVIVGAQVPLSRSPGYRPRDSGMAAGAAQLV